MFPLALRVVLVPPAPQCPPFVVSLCQDGYVRVWDPRSNPRSNPAKVQLHVNEQGRGAVSNICAGG